MMNMNDEEFAASRLNWLRSERNFRTNRGLHVPGWLEEGIREAELALHRGAEDARLLVDPGEAWTPAPVPLAWWVLLVALALSLAGWGLL